MAADGRPTTGHSELERWYRLDLRPKVSRAAKRRAIDPARAVELELTMAALIRREHGARARSRTRRGR